MKLLVPLAERAKRLTGLQRNRGSYNNEHTAKAKIGEGRVSQVNVSLTFKWLLKSWFLRKDVPCTSSEMNGPTATDAASQRQPRRAGALHGLSHAHALARPWRPPGPARWHGRTLPPRWNQHISFSRPLHPNPNLSKVCLFLLVHRTSEKLYSSFGLSQGTSFSREQSYM